MLWNIASSASPAPHQPHMNPIDGCQMTSWKPNFPLRYITQKILNVSVDVTVNKHTPVSDTVLHCAESHWQSHFDLESGKRGVGQHGGHEMTLQELASRPWTEEILAMQNLRRHLSKVSMRFLFHLLSSPLLFSAIRSSHPSFHRPFHLFWYRHAATPVNCT